MLTALNHSMLSLMISIGHRTGLFDWMSDRDEATSEEIAKATSLNERYVREWLGAMTVGGVVECNPEGPKFKLPKEHSAFLTRAAGGDNFGVFAQYVSVLGSVEDGIVECFKNGGGVPYSEFKRFHEVMEEDSSLAVVPALIDSVLPLAPGLADRLREGIDVLDVGCGRGRALLKLAKEFPNSRFVGYDLSDEAIAFAESEANNENLKNIRFGQKDLTAFDENGHTENFDLITAFDAIHDQARPDRVLRGVNKALREDGTFLMIDIAGSSDVYKNYDHPLGVVLYTISCMHCMTVSLAQGGLGFGAMWGEEMAYSELVKAGFTKVQAHHLEEDIQNVYFVVSKN